MRLETDRLILRPPEMADADSITEGLNDWDVARMLGAVPFPYRLADAQEWLAAAPVKRASGQVHAFVLAPRPGAGACIGVTSLALRDHGDIHLGFWLARPHWGRGLMTEAVSAVLGFGFETLDVPRIHSGCLADNPASLRVHLKLGFAVTGGNVLHCCARNAELPHTCLALTRADWRRMTKPVESSP